MYIYTCHIIYTYIQTCLHTSLLTHISILTNIGTERQNLQVSTSHTRKELICRLAHRIHSYLRTYIHAYIHAYIHTHIYIHTYIHTYKGSNVTVSHLWKANIYVIQEYKDTYIPIYHLYT